MENIGNKKYSINIISKIEEVLFFIFTVLQIISLSSFPSFFGKIGQNSIIILMTAVMLGVLSIFTIRTFKQLIIMLLSIVLIILLYICRPDSGAAVEMIYQIIIIFSLSAVGINLYEVISIHLAALSSALLFIVGLSIFGYLPKSGETTTVLFSTYQNTVYSYGFNHPNFLGSILIFIGIEMLFLNWDKKKKFVPLIDVMLITLVIIIGAYTAALGGSIFFLGYILRKKFKNRLYNIMSIFGYSLPVVLALFAIWLARTPYTTVWNIVNRYVTSRPALWTYYFSHFKVKMIGSSVYIINSGINTTYGNGILDGSYIYQLMYNGWVFLAIFICSIIVIGISYRKTGNIAFFWLSIAVAIMAFPENESSSVVLNIFLVILGYYQFSEHKRKKLLINTKIIN